MCSEVQQIGIFKRIIGDTYWIWTDFCIFNFIDWSLTLGAMVRQLVCKEIKSLVIVLVVLQVNSQPLPEGLYCGQDNCYDCTFIWQCFILFNECTRAVKCNHYCDICMATFAATIIAILLTVSQYLHRSFGSLAIAVHEQRFAVFHEWKASRTTIYVLHPPLVTSGMQQHSKKNIKSINGYTVTMLAIFSLLIRYV